ncbi:MAG: head-tail connector protein [Mangrovicoccus sp.]
MRRLGSATLVLAVSVENFGQAMPWIEVDDPLTVESYLYAAQEVVEVASRRPLTERAVEIEFDLAEAHGFRRWWFPIAPVTEVTSVTAVQPLVAETVIDLDQVSLQRCHDEPQLWLTDAALAIADPSKAQSVRVEATVGYAQGELPRGLAHAIILIVKEWYDAGVSIGDLTEASLSFSTKALIKQQRYYRPREFG